jgi:transposase
MSEIQAYVGLDVHKDTLSVAVAEAGREGEVRSWGTIPHETTAINRLVNKLQRKLGVIECVYEAGPCGYGLQRHLAGQNVACRIVAPSKVPVQPGRKRKKNDTHDALNLARLHRAGDLTYIWIPDAIHEAMQDLVRARQTSSHQVRKARQRISCFLLKHGRRYERKKWGYRHRVWLANLQFEHAAQQFALQSYINAEEQAVARRAQIDGQIEDLIPEWRLGSVVRELKALRGIDTVIATAVAAEVGDFSRFDNPRKLMSYLGLVPGEFSSGTRVRPLGITKTGSSDVRSLLFQAAWLYRLTPKVGSWSLTRQQELSQQAKDISWKAQLRLHSRYRRLTETRHKRSQVAVTAIARELVGFIWAIARNAETDMLSNSA